MRENQKGRVFQRETARECSQNGYERLTAVENSQCTEAQMLDTKKLTLDFDRLFRAASPRKVRNYVPLTAPKTPSLPKARNQRDSPRASTR